jgi:polar amino acid transport system permease protein
MILEAGWFASQLKTLWQILLYLLPVVPVTIELTLLSFGLAILLGVFVGIARISHHPVIEKSSKICVDVLRGVPLLVQIFFIYFGLGKVLHFSSFVAGVLAIGIGYSAYLAETVRAGIQSIPKGQYEAALSLGMSRAQMMRHVILPQSLRLVVPPMANDFIACLKDTSLVSVIGMRELTRAGREFYSQYFVDFQTWLVVGLLYLAMTLGLSRLVVWLERRFKVHGLGERGA